MNKTHLKRLLPKKDILERKFKSVKKQLAQAERLVARLLKVLDADQNRLQQLNDIDEFFYGVPLHFRYVDANGMEVTAVCHEIRRGASVYRSSHNRKRFGVNIWEDNFGRKGERWLGAEWPDLVTASIIAKTWVALGSLPKYEPEYW